MENAKTHSDVHYFMYFPGNYRWSAGFLSMLSCSTWGGADIGEVDRIGQILKAAPKQTDEAWFDACVKGAQETHAHGAEDEQVPLADAQALFDACGSKVKTLRVFTPEEGGAQHCMRDYAALDVAEMWNWFEDKLVRN